MEWDNYLSKTQQKRTSPFLVEAVAHVRNGYQALDLGAGALADSRYLLEQGFDVTAVDSSPEVAEYAKDLGGRFHLRTCMFDAYEFPPGTFDLINARYALPFNPPETFESMFERLRASLAPGGVFTGEFFGPEDSWAAREGMTFHDRTDIERLLVPLEILLFEEEKRQGTTALGKEKFWHVFHVTARK